MSIQEGVNKALGIGAVLATQSPLMENQKIKAAKKSEVKRLNTQAGLLNAKVESLDAARAKLLEDAARAKSLKDKATAKSLKNQADNFFKNATYKEANRQLREVNRRLFELNPTTETSQNYYGNFTFKELNRMDNANNKAEEERYSKKVQNQAFKILKESKKNGKT